MSACLHGGEEEHRGAEQGLKAGRPVLQEDVPHELCGALEPQGVAREVHEEQDVDVTGSRGRSQPAGQLRSLPRLEDAVEPGKECLGHHEGGVQHGPGHQLPFRVVPHRLENASKPIQHPRTSYEIK